jgi:hypothetical protein
MQYDHMLNGSGSRQHHQDMIQQAQYNQLLKETKRKERKNIFGIRTILIALFNLIMG